MFRPIAWSIFGLFIGVAVTLLVPGAPLHGSATAEEPPPPGPLGICHVTGPADAPNIQLLTNLGSGVVQKHLDHGDVALEIVVIYNEPPEVYYVCTFEPPPGEERHPVWEAYVDNGFEGGGLLNTACHFTGTMVDIGEFGEVPVPMFVNGPGAAVHAARGDRPVEVPDAIRLVCQ